MKPAGTKRQFDQLVRKLAKLRTTDRLTYLALLRTVLALLRTVQRIGAGKR